MKDTPLGQWLFRARTAKGFTTRETAAAADITQARVTQLEHGASTKMDTVRALARALFLGDPDSDESFAAFEAGAIRAAFPSDDSADWLEAAAEEAGYGDFPTMFNEEEKAEIRDGIVGVAGVLIASKQKRH